MARNLIHLQENLCVRLISAFLVFFLYVADTSGQIDTITQSNDTLGRKSYVIQNVTRNGSTLPEIQIKEVTIYAQPQFPRKSDWRRYERLVYNLKKVYPYALAVRSRLSSVNKDIGNIRGDRERREYLKKVEKDVFAQYEGDIRNMTITQGRLLIKLIDRETQNTSYELIRDYRGKFAAAFWQGIARIFGTNLKDVYDRYGEDSIIESIILEIDAGQL